jgi:hypothetical protein
MTASREQTYASSLSSSSSSSEISIGLWSRGGRRLPGPGTNESSLATEDVTETERGFPFAGAAEREGIDCNCFQPSSHMNSSQRHTTMPLEPEPTLNMSISRASAARLERTHYQSFARAFSFNPTHRSSMVGILRARQSSEGAMRRRTRTNAKRVQAVRKRG